MGAFIKKDDGGFERLVFAEVLIPEVPNTYGDYHTRESVRQFAYGFAMSGYGIDVDHDNDDVSQSVYVVESFIARAGDPDFIEGAWVVGMHIKDDDLWQRILDGEINGYSYEALMYRHPIGLEVPDVHTRYGTTQPDVYDGHTHDFFVLLEENGQVMTGGTTVTDGHAHTISSHTFTDRVLGHSHIYNFVKGSGGL
jgi:hypothetical protein